VEPGDVGFCEELPTTKRAIVWVFADVRLQGATAHAKARGDLFKREQGELKGVLHCGLK
jgi:hypothetical protein